MDPPPKDQPTEEASSSSIRIVSTNTATFSEESRRAIRSHAMRWSRQKRKEAKQRQQSTTRVFRPQFPSNGVVQLTGSLLLVTNAGSTEDIWTRRRKSKQSWR